MDQLKVELVYNFIKKNDRIINYNLGPYYNLSAHHSKSILISQIDIDIIVEGLIKVKRVWEIKSGPFDAFLTTIPFNQYSNLPNYSKEEIDKIFYLLYKLRKGKKPNWFSSSFYKSLFVSPRRQMLIRKYDKYFINLKTISERERSILANELVMLVRNHNNMDLVWDFNSDPY